MPQCILKSRKYQKIMIEIKQHQTEFEAIKLICKNARFDKSHQLFNFIIIQDNYLFSLNQSFGFFLDIVIYNYIKRYKDGIYEIKRNTKKIIILEETNPGKLYLPKWKQLLEKYKELKKEKLNATLNQNIRKIFNLLPNYQGLNIYILIGIFEYSTNWDFYYSKNLSDPVFFKKENFIITLAKIETDEPE